MFAAKTAEVSAEVSSDHTANDAGFLDYLESQNLIDVVAARRVAAACASSGHMIDKVILELGLLPEVKLADAMSHYLDLPRVLPHDFPDNLPDLPGVSISFLQDAGLLPLEVNLVSVTLATARPLANEAANGLAYFLGLKLKCKVATQSELQSHMSRLFNANGVVLNPGSDFIAHEDDIERLKDAARDAPTIKLLNHIVTSAVAQNASDIHVEPLEDHLRIRLRIDGALQIFDTLPLDATAGLVSRIKILSRLNIAEQRLPQDGRMRIPVRGRDVDFRVSTTPILNGESIALRILDRQELPLDFAALGFSEDDARQMRQLTSKPNGIVLVTGPTGSGKTTTLYAALRLLNTTESKIFTVEDPIEYQLAGVNQIQTKPQIGLDFAHVLRSVLRQDPDVIMVGEIRDLETARIAVQAALTGHLVLSTLHTNSAAATLTRLTDMGLEDYLIMTCLHGVVAQRLVRKLCSACKTPAQISNTNAQKLGLPANATTFTATGCKHCGNTGYKGRIVISEILEVTPALRDAVAHHATLDELEILASKQGMTSLYQNGMQRVCDGTTSVEEILRIVASPEL